MLNSTRTTLTALALAMAGLSATVVPAAALAQTAAAAPAKKELVAKAIELQKAGVENLGVALAGQTATQVLQAVGRVIARLPADKREAAARDVQADVKKFHDEVAPILRDRALKLAPTTIGTALEQKMTEDELKTLIVWLESPVSKKFQQAIGESQQALAQAVVNDTKATIQPKLKALEDQISAKLKAADSAKK